MLECMSSQQTRRLALSLVVPLRNEEASLLDLLATIRLQALPPDEVIPGDGGSAGQAVRPARQPAAGEPRFRVLEAGPATPGKGRNVGIAAAQHGWIALTDAGISLEPAWL